MFAQLDSLLPRQTLAECLRHDDEDKLADLARQMAPSLEPVRMRRFRLYIGTKEVARFNGEVMAESWDRAIEQHESLVEDGDRVECDPVREV